jgi:hypothetical protein
MEIKNIIIIILLIITILSLLGINVFIIIGNLFQNLINFIAPVFVKALATLGYTTGTVINNGADIVTNVGKTSLDIANASIHDFNNVLIGASEGNAISLPTGGPLNPVLTTPSLEKAINTQSVRSNTIVQPMPSPSTMPIQNPISSTKTNYCLVGEFQGRHGCIEVGENDLCLSGQLFSSRELCMNPTLTPNMQPVPHITPFNSVSMFPLPPILPGQPNELRPQGIYNA